MFSFDRAFALDGLQQGRTLPVSAAMLGLARADLARFKTARSLARPKPKMSDD
jgi:hypothetical protein